MWCYYVLLCVTMCYFRTVTLYICKVLPGSALLALALEVSSQVLQTDSVQLQECSVSHVALNRQKSIGKSKILEI